MGDLLPNMTQEESTWVYEELGRARQIKNALLTDGEKTVLRGLLEGKQHKDIKNVGDPRGVASTLFQYVKKWTGTEEVDKNTIRTTIEEQLKLRSVRNVPNPSPFYGRENELSTLKQSIVDDLRSLIVLYNGFPGIGKTWLCATLVREEEVYQRYERVIWLSLEHCPSLEQCMFDLKARLPEKRTVAFPDSGDFSFALIDLLSRYSYCLVLDGIEEAFMSDHVRWKPYEQLFRNFVARLDTIHLSGKSCVLITSRIKYLHEEWSKYPDDGGAIRFYQVNGLEIRASQKLFKERGLKDNQTNLSTLLSQKYFGHPLLLNMISGTIHDHFDDSITRFIDLDTTYIRDYEPILSSTFSTIFQVLESRNENILVYKCIFAMLAKAGKPVSMEDLKNSISSTLANQSQGNDLVLHSLQELNRRCLIESETCENKTVYTVNRVLRKYIISHPDMF